MINHSLQRSRHHRRLGRLLKKARHLEVLRTMYGHVTMQPHQLTLLKAPERPWQGPQVEERELDTSKVNQAMSEIKSSQKASQEAQRQRRGARAMHVQLQPLCTMHFPTSHGALHACGRDKELAAVKISAADVELIVREIEVDQKAADRRLREHGGHVFSALKSFI